eukprot:gene25316-biopygen11984
MRGKDGNMEGWTIPSFGGWGETLPSASRHLSTIISAPLDGFETCADAAQMIRIGAKCSPVFPTSAQ